MAGAAKNPGAKAFDFQRRVDEIGYLVADAGPPDSRRALLQDSCLSGHRKHYFLAAEAFLNRRGQRIELIMKDEGWGEGEEERLTTSRIQEFCKGILPVSLKTVLQFRPILEKFAAHEDPEVRAVTSVNGQPFLLGPSSIVPSIFYCRPDQLERLRDKHFPDKGKLLSRTLFGHGHSHTLAILERGQGTQHARVTWHTVCLLAQYLGEDIFDLFSHNPDAGPRRGESTFALSPSVGNLLVPPPSQPKALFKGEN